MIQKSIFSNRILVGIFLLLTTSLANAQDDRYLTSEELTTQKLFIQANQERLLGAYDDAVSLYKQVLEKDRKNHAAAYELSRVYELMEEYNLALESIEAAIRNDNRNQWYLLMKADILEEMEQYPAAADVYLALTDLNAREHHFHEKLIELLILTNQNEAAVEQLDVFEKQAGVIPELIHQKVNLLNQLNQKQRALDEVRKLVRVYPYNPDQLHFAASYATQVNDKKFAESLYARILEIDPNDARASIAGVGKLKEEGSDAAYLTSIQPLIKNSDVAIDAKIHEIIPYIARYAQQPGAVELGEALADVITQLVAAHPDVAKAHAIQGDFLYATGRIAESRKAYERTIVLDEGVFEVWEQLMHTQMAQNDMDAVLHTAEQALDVFPNQAIIYYLTGLAQTYKQDYFEAESALTQALIMSGRNAELRFDILVLLANVYQETDQPKKAYEAFDKALEINADAVRALNDYSYVLTRNGESLDKARRMAEKALSLAANDATVEHTLAWVAFQQDDLRMARTYIELALDHGGADDYTVLEHYGDILYSLNQTDDAVENWQLSMNAGNASEVLKRKIAARKIVH